MTTGEILRHTVKAYNTAKASENRMHDEAVAKQLGFAGGLVPGVDVFAYMIHLPLERWGRAFLERGHTQVSFLKPIYDGQMASVTATAAEEGLSLQIEHEAVICATGNAKLMPATSKLDLEDFQISTPPESDYRPEAGPTSYQIGEWLGISPFCVTPEFHAQYMKDICEDNPLFTRDQIVHPASLLRLANWALMQNVRLGPWIHLGSSMQLFQPSLVGDELTIRALVTANYERKGRRFVHLDAVVVANGDAAVAQIVHSAIYSLQPA